MYNLFEDEDDVFTGSPKSKFMDIVFNANNDVVRHELDKFITKVAAMEMLLEERLENDLDEEVRRFSFTNSMDVDTKAKSLYVELMGAIVTQSE